MKILVVKLADLGDLFLSEPALRSLRIAFPDAQINVLTTPNASELLSHFSLNLNAITLDKSAFDSPGFNLVWSAGQATKLGLRLRRFGYDRVVILHHLTTGWGAAKYEALARAVAAPMVVGLDNGRGRFLTKAVLDRGFGHKHETEYMLEVAIVAGGTSTLPVPRFTIRNEPNGFDLPSRFVVLAPGAGAYSHARIWPPDRFAKLGQELVARGYHLVIVGAADERSLGTRVANAVQPDQVTNLCGKSTLNQLATILSSANAVVGNDSFPAHLAAAVGVPTLAIFGPSNAASWRPAGTTVSVLSAGLPCSPCLYTGFRLGRRAGCRARTCLAAITPVMALDATLEILRA